MKLNWRGILPPGRKMEADQQAIGNLQSFLQIRTVHPNPDYDGSTAFLTKIAKELDLPFVIHYVAVGKPIFIMTFTGQNPSLPSLLLNSHVDVVPVSAEKWNFDPFGGEIHNGKIYGRGSQDMKSVGIGYIEAIRKLSKQSGIKLQRTVHLMFVPDEEIGGVEGMKLFVGTAEFRNLNVGFAIDEGIPSITDKFYIFNSERAPWWIKITATGNGGHGSALLQATAMERMLRVLEKFSSFRQDQVKLLTSSDNVIRDCGRFTSVNITMINGGNQVNVIPDEVTAHVDIRVANDLGEEGIYKLLEEWTNIPGISFEITNKSTLLPETCVDDSSPFWLNVKNALDQMEIGYDIATFPGATDSRYLRAIGLPALGISPFRHTPILLHDHDEYLSVDAFLEGIKFYESLITFLCL